VREKYKHIHYAESRGFDDSVLQTVHSTRHFLGLKKGNLISEEWLRYMIWCSRKRNRAIVFVWKRTGRIHEQLMNVITQRYLIVRGGDFSLGGTLGKFEKPGSQVTIDPPLFDSLLSWLATEAQAQRIIDMAAYLTLGDSGWPPADNADVDIAAQDLVTAYPSLIAAWKGGDTKTHQSATREIIRSVAKWNV
jgi:hypothetical protein